MSEVNASAERLAVVATDTDVADDSLVRPDAEFCITRGAAGYYVLKPRERALLARMFPARSLEAALVAAGWKTSATRPAMTPRDDVAGWTIELPSSVVLSSPSERLILVDGTGAPTSVIYRAAEVGPDPDPLDDEVAGLMRILTKKAPKVGDIKIEGIKIEDFKIEDFKIAGIKVEDFKIEDIKIVDLELDPIETELSIVIATWRLHHDRPGLRTRLQALLERLAADGLP